MEIKTASFVIGFLPALLVFILLLRIETKNSIPLLYSAYFYFGMIFLPTVLLSTVYLGEGILSLDPATNYKHYFSAALYASTTFCLFSIFYVSTKIIVLNRGIHPPQTKAVKNVDNKKVRALLWAVGVSLVLISFVSVFVLIGGVSFSAIQTHLANVGEFRSVGLIGKGYLIFPSTAFNYIGLTILALLIQSNEHWSQRTKILLISGCFIAGLFPGLTLGFRKDLITFSMLFFISILPYKNLKKVVPIGALIGIPIFAVYGIVRNLPIELLLESSDVINTVFVYYETFYSSDMLYEIFRSTFLRIQTLELLALIDSFIDTQGTFGNFTASITEAFTIIIPGSIWGSKAETAVLPMLREMFSNGFYILYGAARPVSGISLTSFGEFYMYFGFMGGILMSALLGVFAGGIEGKLFILRANNSLLTKVCVNSYIPIFLILAENWQGFINSFVIQSVFWVLLFSSFSIAYKIIFSKNKMENSASINQAS